MADITVDARGLQCPMPVIKVAQAVATASSGQTVEVIATDRGALSDIPAWATLGTSGFSNVQLPDEVQEVIIAADGKPVEREAAKKAAGRLIAEGRRVRIAFPPGQGDFNDLLPKGLPDAR